MKEITNLKSNGNTEETRVILNEEQLDLLRGTGSSLHAAETEEGGSYEPKFSARSWREIKNIIPR